MTAGRELDTLVAEKVMGLMKEVRIKGETNHMTIYTSNPYFSDGQCSKDELLRYAMPLHYSTDMASAWLVVEKLKADGNNVWIEWAGAAWICGATTVFPDREADTAPLAICLAALKAVGVDIENDQTAT